jgi:hypothetical protein
MYTEKKLLHGNFQTKALGQILRVLASDGTERTYFDGSNVVYDANDVSNTENNATGRSRKKRSCTAVCVYSGPCLAHAWIKCSLLVKNASSIIENL